MSAQQYELPAEPASSTCPLCSALVQPSDGRCASCGYTLAGIDDRPGPYGPTAAIWAAGALGLVYVVALVIVFLGR